MSKLFIFLFFLLSFVVSGKPKNIEILVQKVSIDSLKRYEFTLASDEFGGRLTNSNVGLLTTNYISNRFKNSGLKAVLENGTSFYQKFQVDYKEPLLSKQQANKNLAIKLKTQDKAEYLAQNVIGVLLGQNTNAKHIVITAHHDHIGSDEDGIKYGADDNGSGISALIEISRIFGEAAKTHIHPKRTLVFISTDAEEKKLVGSDYYVNNPVLPINRTYCNVNLDMIGRVDSLHALNPNLSNYIYCIYQDSSKAVFNDSYLNQINNKYSALELDERYNKDDGNYKVSNLINRSDHYSFLKKGVPSIWLFSGFHDDYHQTTDTADKIRYPELKKRIQFVMALIWDLANN